jgi:hypothetical protein
VKELHRLWTAETPWPGDVPIYILAVCGFERAVQRVRRSVDDLAFPAYVHIADTLGEADGRFREESTIFSDDAEPRARPRGRVRARRGD